MVTVQVQVTLASLEKHFNIPPSPIKTNDFFFARERLRILGKEDELPIEIDVLAKYYMRSISEMIQDWFIGGQKIPLDNFIELLVLAMPEPLKKRLL